MIRICFVCLGNICRSPTAEGVMAWLIAQEGLADRIAVDSAGTGAWHAGEPPDERAFEAARLRGIPLGGKARQVRADDFRRFDLLVAMDRQNRDRLRALAPDDEARARVVLLRGFDPDSPSNADVPDPYYGGPDGFETVLDLCLVSCRGLLASLQPRLAH